MVGKNDNHPLASISTTVLNSDANNYFSNQGFFSARYCFLGLAGVMAPAQANHPAMFWFVAVAATLVPAKW